MFIDFFSKVKALHLSRPPGPEASIMLAPSCGGAQKHNWLTPSDTMAVYVSPSMRPASIEMLYSELAETSSLEDGFG